MALENQNYGMGVTWEEVQVLILTSVITWLVNHMSKVSTIARRMKKKNMFLPNCGEEEKEKTGLWPWQGLLSTNVQMKKGSSITTRVSSQQTESSSYVQLFFTLGSSDNHANTKLNVSCIHNILHLHQDNFPSTTIGTIMVIFCTWESLDACSQILAMPLSLPVTAVYATYS